MANLISVCLEVPPIEEPLKNKADEDLAQAMAMYRMATVASKSLGGKKGTSAKWIRALITGGPPEVSKKRGDQFKGRVHHLVVEMDEEITEAKRALVVQAVRTYMKAMEDKFMRLNPKEALSAAKHVLDDTGFFENGNGAARKQRDRKELEMKVRKILARRKRSGAGGKGK